MQIELRPLVQLRHLASVAHCRGTCWRCSPVTESIVPCVNQALIMWLSQVPVAGEVCQAALTPPLASLLQGKNTEYPHISCNRSAENHTCWRSNIQFILNFNWNFSHDSWLVKFVPYLEQLSSGVNALQRLFSCTNIISSMLILYVQIENPIMSECERLRFAVKCFLSTILSADPQ